MTTKAQHRITKLDHLADQYGLDVDEMLESAVFDSVAPGICFAPGCDYTTDVEPDAARGWCEGCDAPRVAACWVLAELI